MDMAERRGLTGDAFESYRDNKREIGCYSVKTGRMVTRLREIAVDLTRYTSDDFRDFRSEIPQFDFEEFRANLGKLQALHAERRRLYGELCRLGYEEIVISGEEDDESL